MASPSAHGQATISTAIAAVNAAAGPPPTPIQNPNVAAASRITIGTNSAETRSANRWMAPCRLRLFHQRRDVGQLRVGSDADRPDHEPAADVDASTDHRLVCADLDGDGLAGEHAGVDRRCAVHDDPVRRDLLAGTDDEHVTDHEPVDRDAFLPAVAQDRGLRPPSPAATRAPRRSGGGRAPRRTARRARRW